MPNCPKCGALYGTGDDFCPQCGKKIKQKVLEIPKSSFGKAWVITLGIVIVFIFLSFFLFSTSQVGRVKPSPQMEVVPESYPKAEVIIKEQPKEKPAQITYPDDFILKYDELPEGLVYANFKNPKSREEALKEIGLYGLENPGYLPEKAYHWAYKNHDKNRIGSIFSQFFDEPSETAIIIINYNSETDLETELPKVLRVYERAEHQILRYKNILVIVWSDGDYQYEISDNLKGRIPLTDVEKALKQKV